ncbi:MAG: hypothetical protein ACOYD5_11835, partial [Negativicutes bacterium]
IMQGEYLVSPAIAQGIQSQHVILTWLQNAMSVRVENLGINSFLIEIDSSTSIFEYKKEHVVFR